MIEQSILIHDNSPSFKYIDYISTDYLLTICYYRRSMNLWGIGLKSSHGARLVMGHQEPGGGNRHSCRASHGVKISGCVVHCGTLYLQMASKWFGLLGNASQENEDNHWSFGDPISLITFVAYQWKTCYLGTCGCLHPQILGMFNRGSRNHWTFSKAILQMDCQ